jgi:uncharacterized protein YjdB
MGCGIAATMTSCSKDKDYTTGLPENQLLNSVELKVSAELPLLMGTDSTLVCAVTPANATFSSLQWKSSNESVATVAQDGTVHAKALGKTTITVCPSVGFGSPATQKSISVVVIDKVVKVTDIVFNNQEKQLFESDHLQLTYDLLPADHTYSYLTWESSDPTVATVDENGLVTGLKNGEVTISAIAHDKSGTVGRYKLQVVKSVPAQSVSLTPHPEPLSWMQTLVLQYTKTPELSNDATIEWATSNAKVLTVDRGVVTAVGFGTATITATCTATGNKSEIELTVASGFYNWHFDNLFEGWSINSNLGSFEVKDGKMECTVSADKRIYLQRCYSTARNIMDLNFKEYPVIAFNSSALPDGSVVQLNLANLGNSLNLAKNMSKKVLADGTQVWWYDCSSVTNVGDEQGVVPIRAFIFKITKVEVPTFDIGWIRTFKSVDEMNEIVGN